MSREYEAFETGLGKIWRILGAGQKREFKMAFRISVCLILGKMNSLTGDKEL